MRTLELKEFMYRTKKNEEMYEVLQDSLYDYTMQSLKVRSSALSEKKKVANEYYKALSRCLNSSKEVLKEIRKEITIFNMHSLFAILNQYVEEYVIQIGGIHYKSVELFAPSISSNFVNRVYDSESPELLPIVIEKKGDNPRFTAFSYNFKTKRIKEENFSTLEEVIEKFNLDFE